MFIRLLLITTKGHKCEVAHRLLNKSRLVAVALICARHIKFLIFGGHNRFQMLFHTQESTTNDEDGQWHWARRFTAWIQDSLMINDHDFPIDCSLVLRPGSRINQIWDSQIRVHHNPLSWGRIPRRQSWNPTISPNSSIFTIQNLPMRTLSDYVPSH